MLSVGTASEDAYRYYGVSGDRLFFTPWAVDNDYFMKECERYGLQKEATRRELGITDNAPIIVQPHYLS